MNLGRILSIALLIIALGFGQYSSASDPSASLKNATLYSRDVSYLPRLTVEPESGATFIVWSAYIKSGGGEKVLARFITKKKSSWKLSGVKTIAPVGLDASLACNTIDKTFLVVWDNLRIGEWEQSEIIGQVFNVKGKRASGIIHYDHMDIVNYSPYVVYNPKDSVFLMIWHRGWLWTSQQSLTGVVSVILNNDGEQKTVAKNIREGIIEDSYIYDCTPISGSYNTRSGRAFFIVCEDVPIPGSQAKSRYYLYRLDKNGNLFGRTVLTPVAMDIGLWYTSVTCQHSTKEAHHFAAWTDDGELHLQKITRKGGNKGPVIDIAGVNGAKSTSMCYSPDRDIYLIAFNSNKGIEALFLDKSGNAVVNRQVLSTDIESYACAVEWNPVMEEFIILWLEQTSSSNRLLRMTTLEPPAVN